MEDCSYALPLHRAVKRRDAKACRLILRQADCDVNAVDEVSHHTALHIACKYGFVAIAKILLDRRASQKCGGNYGESGYTALHVAAMSGSAGAVKLLVQRSADVQSVAQGLTPLHLACKFGHLKAAFLLLSRGSDVNKVTEDSRGCTALHYAAQFGREQIVKLLIHKNADIYFLDKYGRSALHCAWKNGDPEIGELLVRAAKFFASASCVADAAKGSRAVTEKVVKLLLNCEDNVNVKDGVNYTPLQWACRGKSPRVAESLLKSGADVNAVHDLTGNTALHFAVDGVENYEQDTVFKIELVELLLQYGADVNAKSGLGRTPVTDFLSNYDDSDKGIIAEIFAKQVAKMQALNLFVDESNLQALFEHELIRDFFADCGTEIGILRDRKIGDSTVTYLDVLGKGVVRLADYMANDSILTAFESGDYELEFPIYSENLLRQFVLGRERLDLLRKCDAVLNVSNFRFVPYVCMRHIKRCLTNDDLKGFFETHDNSIGLPS